MGSLGVFFYIYLYMYVLCMCMCMCLGFIPDLLMILMCRDCCYSLVVKEVSLDPVSVKMCFNSPLFLSLSLSLSPSSLISLTVENDGEIEPLRDPYDEDDCTRGEPCAYTRERERERERKGSSYHH